MKACALCSSLTTNHLVYWKKKNTRLTKTAAGSQLPVWGNKNLDIPSNIVADSLSYQLVEDPPAEEDNLTLQDFPRNWDERQLEVA